MCVCVCVCVHARARAFACAESSGLVSTSEQQVGLLRLSYKRLSKTTSVDHLRRVCVCV